MFRDALRVVNLMPDFWNSIVVRAKSYLLKCGDDYIVVADLTVRDLV